MKLVIAEKPSVAMSIARVIGADEKSDGYCSGNGYIVTWCVGHLISAAEPETYDSRYKEWSLDTLPMLPQPFRLKVSDDTKSQFEIVKKIMERDDVSELICATDAGREGELIFRLVYNVVGCTKPFERLWISSMEEKTITEGFSNLKPGTEYDNLFKAAFTRLRADWYVGMNFSRLFSGLYRNNLPVGRVQTAVTNLVVKRQLEIDNFKPVPYFVLEADCGDFIAKSDKFDTKEAAEEIRNICNGKSGIIAELDEQQHKDNPPTLFDLTTFQREANKTFGYTAQQVLDVAQSLYEKGLLTYPRTDSKYLTEDMQFSTEKLIDDLLQSNLVAPEIQQYYDKEKKSMQRCIDGSKVSDHHAIIPTETLLKKDMSDLTTTERNCLNLVIYRLLAASYEPCVYNETTVKLVIAEKEFIVKGKKLVNSGYRTIIDFVGGEKNKDSNKDSSIPSTVTQNKIYDNIKVSITEHKTAPPKPYNDDSLLSAMENAGRQTDNEDYKSILKECKGIGTPATRAGIIEKLIKTKYIEREKKVFVPTNKAIALITVVPEEVKSVDMTAQWEQQLDLISKGELSDTDFMNNLFDYISSVVQSSKQSAGTVNTDMFKPKYDVIGVCPRCGKNVLNYPKTYSCESGKGGCGFVVFKNNKWWKEKKKTLSPSMIGKFLKDGKVKVKGLYSAKKDKKYDATVAMVDTGKYINFELIF